MGNRLVHCGWDGVQGTVAEITAGVEFHLEQEEERIMLWSRGRGEPWSGIYITVFRRWVQVCGAD